MILAGDIGGTKTELALFDRQGDQLHLVREARFPSRSYPSLLAIVRQFFAGQPAASLDAACFGVAGPVIDGRATTTNLPWLVDEHTLVHEIPVGRAQLLNDLEAMAWGMMSLPPADFATLQPGTPRAGNMALVAAGTGLGEALMIWDGTRHLVVPSEGGHVDFAPRDERELELLAFLRRISAA